LAFSISTELRSETLTSRPNSWCISSKMWWNQSTQLMTVERADKPISQDQTKKPLNGFGALQFALSSQATFSSISHAQVEKPDRNSRRLAQQRKPKGLSSSSRVTSNPSKSSQNCALSSDRRQKSSASHHLALPLRRRRHFQITG
jgi:hypothetical protein